VELLRDLFDLPISVGTIHNRLQSAADKAAAINLTQDLSAIRVGLQDEIFQGSQPVLVGSMPSQLTATYWRRLDTGMRTLGECIYWMLASNIPDYTIADAAKGLRAGQAAAAAEDTLSWRYFSHPASRQRVVGFLSRRAATANSRAKARAGDAQS